MGMNENITRTALLISELRAQERERTPRLFDDPYAPLFSSPESRAVLERLEALGPVFPSAIRARTRWFDDVVQRELRRGTKQVLVLGAGLDCRALRFAPPGTRFFEIDSPSVLAFKADRLAKAGHGLGAVPIGLDYLAPGLFDLLGARGFDRGQRTLVLWEGNTYYLRPDDARGMLRLLGESLASASVVFDYCGTAVIEGRSRVPIMNTYTAALRAMGAPWQCGIDDVAELARATGFEVSEDVLYHELVQRLLPADRELAEVDVEFGMCVLARPAHAA